MIENHRLIFNTCDKIFDNINILSKYEYYTNSHIRQIYNLSILYLSDDNGSIIKFKNSVRNIIRNMIKSKEGEDMCYKIINEN
jgi:hypothetical protein